MARWIVLFNDTPGMLVHRRKFGDDHIRYLKKNADKILVGGGLRHVPDSPFVGGLWIVEAEDFDIVNELVLEDPYFNPNHRRYQIFAWAKAIDQPVEL